MLKMKMNTLGLDVLKKRIDSLAKESATVVANIAAEEFVEMLYEAPQYSGNYVANMVIQGGDVAKKPAEMIFEIPKNDSEAVARGALQAIDAAKKENSGLVRQAAGHIVNGKGWLKTITIYNKLGYADKVESLDRLRKENAGGEHAVAKMIDRLKQRAGSTILHGSPEYTRLANTEVL